MRLAFTNRFWAHTVLTGMKTPWKRATLLARRTLLATMSAAAIWAGGCASTQPLPPAPALALAPAEDVRATLGRIGIPAKGSVPPGVWSMPAKGAAGAGTGDLGSASTLDSSGREVVAFGASCPPTTPRSRAAFLTIRSTVFTGPSWPVPGCVRPHHYIDHGRDPGLGAPAPDFPSQSAPRPRSGSLKCC